MPINISPKISLIFSFILLVFLFGLYFWQINVIIIQTYWHDAILSELEKLNKEYSKLFVAYSETGSLENGAKIDKLSEFEPVDTISYIKLLNGVVVAKNIAP